MRCEDIFETWDDFNAEWCPNDLNIPVRCFFDKEYKTFSVDFAHPLKHDMSEISVRNVTKKECEEWVSKWRPKLMKLELL
jgi:hypothetical protein